MISRSALSRYQARPISLRYTDIRTYVILATFVLLSVAVPWALHQFRLAGATFLPMHFFVLAAGLLFGWRAGLLVGLLTPPASYFATGMPVLPILPQVIAELAAYGVIAGLLRERFHLRTAWALMGALLGGRLVLLLMMVTMSFVLGEVSSPLGVETSPFAALWSVIQQGWPGIAAQLLVIPPVVWWVERRYGLLRPPSADSQ